MTRKSTVKTTPTIYSIKRRLSSTLVQLLLMNVVFLGSVTAQTDSGHWAGQTQRIDTQRASSQRPLKADRIPYAPPSLLIHRPPPLKPVQPVVFSHGDRSRKEVALTFDACSTRKPSHYDERVTKVLLDTKTPATIFLGGKWMLEEPDHTRLLASSPQFELGNHTFLHPHLTEVSDERVKEELRRTQEVMYSLTGRQPTLFRPPYGEYDERVVRLAAEMGLTTVEYDLPSGDPDTTATKEKLIEYVTWKARPGSIIVMHINTRGWHTSEALPEIIAKLRKRGFTFVTVSQLLRDSRPAEGPR